MRKDNSIGFCGVGIMETFIKSSSINQIVKILRQIQENHDLTTLEDFGMRVSIKKLKERKRLEERISVLEKAIKTLQLRLG